MLETLTPDRAARLLVRAARNAGTLNVLGGQGSGNFGHAGRPGEVGGSADGVPSDAERRTPPASWHEPTTNVFAQRSGLLTEADVTMDWLERHKIPKVGDKYVMYHATPAVNAFTVLRPGSYLDSDPETARHQAGRDRGPKAGKIAVYEVHFYPWELGALTTWAVTRSPLPLQKMKTLGGQGSGNFGHAGRPGEVGGSGPGDQKVFDAMATAAFSSGRIPAIATRMTGYSPADTEQGVRDRIHLWSEGTNWTPDAQRMQQAVAVEFGVTTTTDRVMTPNVDATPTDFDRQYVRAEYAATQQWFKDLGVTHVTVYRGMLSGLPPGTGTVQVKMQPASSWTLDSSVAYQFADSTLADRGVIVARVPVSRVLSTSATGRGSASESEVILVGGELSVQLRPDRVPTAWTAPVWVRK